MPPQEGSECIPLLQCPNSPSKTAAIFHADRQQDPTGEGDQPGCMGNTCICQDMVHCVLLINLLVSILRQVASMPLSLLLARTCPHNNMQKRDPKQIMLMNQLSGTEATSFKHLCCVPLHGTYTLYRNGTSCSGRSTRNLLCLHFPAGLNLWT